MQLNTIIVGGSKQELSYHISSVQTLNIKMQHGSSHKPGLSSSNFPMRKGGNIGSIIVIYDDDRDASIHYLTVDHGCPQNKLQGTILLVCFCWRLVDDSELQ